MRFTRDDSVSTDRSEFQTVRKVMSSERLPVMADRVRRKVTLTEPSRITNNLAQLRRQYFCCLRSFLVAGLFKDNRHFFSGCTYQRSQLDPTKHGDGARRHGAADAHEGWRRWRGGGRSGEHQPVVCERVVVPDPGELAFVAVAAAGEQPDGGGQPPAQAPAPRRARPRGGAGAPPPHRRAQEGANQVGAVQICAPGRGALLPAGKASSRRGHSTQCCQIPLLRQI